MIIWDADLDLLLQFVAGLKNVGAELMLDRMGWVLTVQFVAFEDPTVARILLMPHPNGRAVSKGLILTFLRVILFRFALPKPGQVPHDACRVRIRAEGCSVYHSSFAADTRCSDFTDAWEQASTLVSLPGDIRLVINGRQASPEFLLSDYMKTGPTGESYAQIALIYPQHGGGPKDEQEKPSTGAKNMLATWLLSQGGTHTMSFHLWMQLPKLVRPPWPPCCKPRTRR